MVNVTGQHEDRVTTITIDLGITVESKLHVCLVQLPASPSEAIKLDASRPLAVTSLTQLLAGGGDHKGPALAEMVPGNEAVLIVLPEFAFGLPDWDVIDTIIRGVDRPLIVLAGFGASPGASVVAWAEAGVCGGETRRHLGWDQEGNKIASARRVNGGWCWVHVPGETHCITYLKRVAEQNKEAVQIADLQFGRVITHLRFNDVDLFPLICADMLQLPGDHADGAQAQIAGLLQSIPGDRPAMVVGSLLQTGYNINWVRAVDSLLVHVLAGRPGLVALCNIACDQVSAAEEQDQWRSLTGVFGKWDELTRGQANLPCGRRVMTQGIVGAVARYSNATVTSGAVDWGPYGPVDGKFVWHAEMLCPIDDTGLIAPVDLPPVPHACEISRFLRRHPGEGGWSPRLSEGSEFIQEHLATNDAPQAKQILDELLHGPTAHLADPDCLHEAETQLAARLGLHALATLITIGGTEWRGVSGQQGQLRLIDGGRNLLIWRDAVRTKGQMRAILSEWQQEGGEHPDLVVIGQSRFGDIDEGDVEKARRDDFSAAPRSIAGTGDAFLVETVDITEPHARRNATVVNLAVIASIYAEHEHGVDDAPSVAALLARLATASSEVAA